MTAGRMKKSKASLTCIRRPPSFKTSWTKLPGNKNVIDRIIAAVNPRPEEKCEIGPVRER